MIRGLETFLAAFKQSFMCHVPILASGICGPDKSLSTKEFSLIVFSTINNTMCIVYCILCHIVSCCVSFRHFVKTSRCPLVFIVSDSLSGDSSSRFLFPREIQEELDISSIRFQMMYKGGCDRDVRPFMESHSRRQRPLDKYSLQFSLSLRL